MAGNDGRVAQVTPDDAGPIIAITTWLFMIMMILSVIFRVVIKLFVRRKLKLDDYMVCGALLFGVSQSVVISFSIQDGLGRRKVNLNAEQLASIKQTLYAADLLLIPACGLSKISLLQLIQDLAVSKIQLAITKSCIYIVLAWMIAASFALAFQCSLPHPWDSQSGHCLNQFIFWVIISTIDMCTEMAVIALPAFMMRPVQMALSKKLTVIICFMFRICVTICSVVRLYFLQSYQDSSDFVFDTTASSIATQILISIAITTACIPSLKPFLDSFESGALNIYMGRSGHDLTTKSYEMSNMKNSSMRSKTGEVVDDVNFRRDGTGHRVAISGQGSSRRRDHDSDSLQSENSVAMIIKRTDQWTVHYDHNDGLSGTSRGNASGNEN